MSEKILILPKEDAEFIYPYEIDYNFKGTISAWENNKLIGFIFHNDDDEWIFVKGVEHEGWYGTIEERAKKANYYKQIYVDRSTGNLSIYTPNGWKDLTFTKISSQANSTATDITALQADFNALLSKLKSAGLMD